MAMLLMLLMLLSCRAERGRATSMQTTRPATPSIHHILLEVSDLKRSLAFYRDQMGLKLTSRKGDFATLESANIGIYLWQSRWDWEAPQKADERKGLGI